MHACTHKVKLRGMCKCSSMSIGNVLDAHMHSMHATNYYCRHTCMHACMYIACISKFSLTLAVCCHIVLVTTHSVQQAKLEGMPEASIH